jgi:hypothetical protein
MLYTFPQPEIADEDVVEAEGALALWNHGATEETIRQRKIDLAAVGGWAWNDRDAPRTLARLGKIDLDALLTAWTAQRGPTDGMLKRVRSHVRSSVAYLRGGIMPARHMKPGHSARTGTGKKKGAAPGAASSGAGQKGRTS